MYVDASEACNDLVFLLGDRAFDTDLSTRSWSVRVTQLECGSNNLAPSGMLIKRIIIISHNTYQWICLQVVRNTFTETRAEPSIVIITRYEKIYSDFSSHLGCVIRRSRWIIVFFRATITIWLINDKGFASEERRVTANFVTVMSPLSMTFKSPAPLPTSSTQQPVAHIKPTGKAPTMIVSNSETLVLSMDRP